MAKEISTKWLKDFRSIPRPSSNRDANKQTFAYRLSELVFGSLLASYVLGFISFAAVYVQPSAKYHFKIKEPDELISAIAANPMLTMGDLAKKFSIDATDQGLYVNLLLKTIFSINILMIFQQLLISVLFAAFTALLYVNYHQSILYLSADQRKSSNDFILAIGVGISFGVSMIFPLSTIFWLGLLSVFVFRRRDVLVAEFIDHTALQIASEIGQIVQPGANPGDEEKNRARVVGRIVPQIREALQSSENPIIVSWMGTTTWRWNAVIGLMLGLPVALFTLELVTVMMSHPFELSRNAQIWVVLANTICCAAASAFLLGRQINATHVMPSQEDEEDTDVDQEMNSLLLKIKESEIGKASGERGASTDG